MQSNRVKLSDIKIKDNSLIGSLKKPEAIHSYPEGDGMEASLLFRCPNIKRLGNRFFKDYGLHAVVITTNMDDDNTIDFEDAKRQAARACYSIPK